MCIPVLESHTDYQNIPFSKVMTFFGSEEMLVGPQGEDILLRLRLELGREGN